jgi:hypothetical protein
MLRSHSDSNNRNNREQVKGESQDTQGRLRTKGNRHSMAKILLKNPANA